MNFNEVNDFLQQLFSEIDFFKVAHQKDGLHSFNKTTETWDGGYISISYPGYKARQRAKTKDYCVNLHRGDFSTSLSHVNIVVDIYNKIQNGMDLESFTVALCGFAVTGDISLINNIQYTPSNPPSEELISRVIECHPDDKIKGYNRDGNFFDWTIFELFVCIKWIAVQEDINYPGGMGRKMPFLRYYETIYTGFDGTHTLEEVINRTLGHNIPNGWDELKHENNKI